MGCDERYGTYIVARHLPSSPEMRINPARKTSIILIICRNRIFSIDSYDSTKSHSPNKEIGLSSNALSSPMRSPTG